jgi:hypothetical protein
MSTKTILVVIIAATAVGIGLVVCGGLGALWYYRFYRPPDVGPVPGQALVLPADTAAILGIDVNGMFASPAYKGLAAGNVPGLAGTLSPEEAEKTKRELREGIEKALRETEARVGIRLDRDLDRVVVAASKVDAPQPDVAVLAFGRFDPAKMQKAIESAAKDGGATITRRDVSGVGVQMIRTSGGPELALGMLDAGRLVAGTPAAVAEVVSAHAAGARPLQGNASLLSLARGVEPAAGFWVLLDQPLIARLQKQAPAAPGVPLPRAVSLAGRFDGGLTLVAEMADAAAASALVATVQGGIDGLRAQAAQGPAEAAAAKAFLDAVQVRADASRVTLTAGAPGSSGSLAALLGAIAAPSLMRARVSANEAAAIGDIRAVLSAQAAYQATIGGFYGDVPCLAEPGRCVQGYSGPPMLDATLAGAREKSGYRRAFHGGARVGERGLVTFAYTATPIKAGETGVRSFCGDASGRLCFDPTGAAILPRGGACPPSCLPLR